MREVPIRIPTGGKHVKVTMLGEREEKLGGIAGSENDKRMMQDRLCSVQCSLPAGTAQSPTKKVILVGVRISSCYTRKKHFTLETNKRTSMNQRFFPWVMLPILLLLAGCPNGGGGNGGFGDAAPSGVVISPNGSFLYVSNRGLDSVSAYTIGGGGALTPITGSPFPAGTSPSAVTISPNGSFLYVSNRESDNVSAYTIEGTGALTPVTGSPFQAGTNPSAVTVSPNGSFLYVSNQGSNNVSAYTITAGTGVLVPLTPGVGNPFAVGTSPSALTISSNGSFLYVSNQGSNNVSAYTITTGTGVLASVAGSPFAAGTSPSGVTVSPNDAFLYVSNQGSNNVSAYTITAGTGVLASVAGSPFPAETNPSAVTVSPNGSFLYVSNQGSNNVSAYTITAGTGVLVPLIPGVGNPFAAGTSPSALTISSNGSFLYVSNQGSNNVSAYTITTGTGVLASVAGSPF
ncbi:MAG: lactonase family protein [Nitrospira sp.]|jgi:6-phosphogluconolactonase (cycloisomerase 2 family)|nr:MAG: lactonase family protein [Nitrospira sp.]